MKSTTVEPHSQYAEISNNWVRIRKLRQLSAQSYNRTSFTYEFSGFTSSEIFNYIMKIKFLHNTRQACNTHLRSEVDLHQLQFRKAAFIWSYGKGHRQEDPQNNSHIGSISVNPHFTIHCSIVSALQLSMSSSLNLLLWSEADSETESCIRWQFVAIDLIIHRCKVVYLCLHQFVVWWF